MKKIYHHSEDQRRILALLEEAGEEDILTLANTFSKGQYVSDMIGELCIALTDLVEDGLIGIATSFDAASRQWQLLPKKDAFEVLSDLESHTGWSSQSSSWRWLVAPPLYAVLTDAGLVEADKILKRDGWKARDPR